MVLISDLRKHKNMFFIILILIGIMLFFHRFNLVLIDINEDTAVIKINFLIPMKQFKIEESIKIKSFTPGSKYHCDLKWENENVLRVNLKEISNFKGQKVMFTMNGAETKIPFISKSLSVDVQFQTEPRLIKVENDENISTEGPLILQFNTPMDIKSTNQFIQSDIQFEISPYQLEDNEKHTDYCKLMLYPKEKMKNESNYLVIIKKGLKAQCGHTIKEDIKIQIHTASKPYIIDTVPRQSAKWVALYPKMSAQMSEDFSDAIITIDGVKQNVKIKGDKLEFLPYDILKPEKEYEVNIQGISKFGEKTEPYIIKFTTMPLKEEELWVEVVLKEKHEVLIHKGKDIIRRMPASGGLPDQPSVVGTFYIQDRGSSFFSPRFNEGAVYWVRIIDQFLFHGIPRDNHWNIIQTELDKIGKPASHGCIRMLDEDAKWFYENIPHGTMVIIHE